MPSWTLPLLKGNPRWGQRLSSANTFPSYEQSSIGRFSPRTVIIRFSCNSASDAARKNSAKSGGMFSGGIRNNYRSQDTEYRIRELRSFQVPNEAKFPEW